MKNLKLQSIVGLDAWNARNPQTCLISMTLNTNFKESSATDDLKFSLNYAVLCNDITNLAQSKKEWKSVYAFSNAISSYTMNKYEQVDKLNLDVQLTNAHLRTQNVSFQVGIDRNDKIPASKYMLIKNLDLFTLIGVFNFERLQKQKLSLDIKLPVTDEHSDIPFKTIIDKVVTYTEGANFKTVEALGECIIKLVSQDPFYQDTAFLHSLIEVTVIKHNAITETDGVGISCARSPEEVVSNPTIKLNGTKESSESNGYNMPVDQSTAIATTSTDINTKYNTAYLAFGSNVGDRVSNIKLAFDALKRENEKIVILDQSSFFESEPMYFKDQEPFINGCIKIKTILSPHELLRVCKHIEYEVLGRVKHFDNGPRSIDLDIVLYQNADNEPILINDEDLIIPHPRMLERSFVLEPLCQLLPPTTRHPITAEPIWNHLDELYAKGNDEDNLWLVTPLPGKTLNTKKEKFLKFKTVTVKDPITNLSKRESVSPTYIMHILNVTPDSFSDGGKYYSPENISTTLHHLVQVTQEVLKLHDCIIIDVGGCSTRPNSEQVSEKNELGRVIPIISAIRTCKELPKDKVIISVDTYRSTVSQQAFEAGADIVNDISGGAFDSNMFSQSARIGGGYVLSHTRGTISTMNKLTDYTWKNTDVMEGKYVHYISGKEIDPKNEQLTLITTIGQELSVRFLAALDSGLHRGQMILDPGLGFAKNLDQNLEIIRTIPLLKNYSCVTPDGRFVTFKNLPILLGPSRKKFIGTITMEPEPHNRDFATGSVVASCIGYGTDIVRVHDSINCSKSVKIADKIYKKV